MKNKYAATWTCHPTKEDKPMAKRLITNGINHAYGDIIDEITDINHDVVDLKDYTLMLLSDGEPISSEIFVYINTTINEILSQFSKVEPQIDLLATTGVVSTEALSARKTHKVLQESLETLQKSLTHEVRALVHPKANGCG